MRNYFGYYPKRKTGPFIWVHGVSLGETLVADFFAGRLSAMYPKLSFGLTTTHPDCLKLARKKSFFSSSVFFPLDFRPFIKRALSSWNPDLVLICETDFWPEFLFQCWQRRIPVVLLNGRISNKHEWFFSNSRRIGEMMFGCFTILLVQTEIDKKRLTRMGAPLEKIKVLGNIKSDMTPEIDFEKLDSILRWVNDKKLVIFGSLHPTELEILFPSICNLAKKEGLKVLIAPRNIKNCNIWKARFEEEGVSSMMRSEIVGNQTNLLFLDTIGELASIYSLSSIAFLGGTLDEKVGGHNPLEVMRFGKALLVGPYARNFQDIVDQLIEFNGCRVVKSGKEFDAIVQELLNNPKISQEIGSSGKQVYEANRGSLNKTIECLQPLLNGIVYNKV
ncbi:MAG: hypothetical protein HQM08_15245 [Candidatus Riflebacteria bacterium]|nr:hypothetical protein [Candidatus Riflebacteria bacterium]